MDRVQASEAWGRGFESHAARQRIEGVAHQAQLLFFVIFGFRIQLITTDRQTALLTR